jgi:hypothetical protein
MELLLLWRAQSMQVPLTAVFKKAPQGYVRFVEELPGVVCHCERGTPSAAIYHPKSRNLRNVALGKVFEVGQVLVPAGGFLVDLEMTLNVVRVEQSQELFEVGW